MKCFFSIFAFLLCTCSVFASSDSLLAQLPDTFDVKNKDHYLKFASTNLDQRNFELAKALIEKGLALGVAEKDNDFMTMLNYYLADYYYYTQDYKKAQLIYFDVLPRFEIMEDTLMVAKSLNSIGLIYCFQNDNDNTLKYYLKEVELLGEVTNPDRKIETERMMVLTNLINLYSNKKQYGDVVKNCSVAIDLAHNLPDSVRLGSLLNVLGLAYKNTQQYTLALNTLLEAQTIFENLHDDFRKAFVVLNMGAVYECQKKFDLALKYFGKALAMFEQENYMNGILIAKQGIAESYFGLGKYELSKQLFLSIVDSCKAYEFNNILITSYDQLAEIEYKQGDYKQAYEYRKNHNELNDSIFNEESESQYAELETKYKTAQKEAEIISLKSERTIREIELHKNKLLKWLGFSFSFILFLFLFIVIQLFNQKRKANELLIEKSTQIEKQNQQLISMNQEISEINEKLNVSQGELTSANNAKNRFFSILAHDLKNPFHNILGESFLLSTMYEKLSADERKRYASDLYSSSEQVHRLLDNLLEWTRTQTNGIKFQPQYTNLNELVVNAVSILKSSADNKSITIINHTDPHLSIVADVEMLETIIRNTMNNSIKFTQSGGEITVSCQQENNCIIVCVEDNGVGIEKENLEKLFQLDSNYKTKGTNGERGTGLGLVICKEFVDYHNGKIWAESTLGKGSKFFVSLPVS
jgi:signal transduction histidine kinase